MRILPLHLSQRKTLLTHLMNCWKVSVTVDSDFSGDLEPNVVELFNYFEDAWKMRGSEDRTVKHLILQSIYGMFSKRLPATWPERTIISRDDTVLLVTLLAAATHQSGNLMMCSRRSMGSIWPKLSS
ncbi:hypothetical protein T10_7295 [Trichinella papuae]|uniref:Uncharacterized protein n=1 Tax=Trichinella papuae TaxID=268474 RepID=A0A0V1MH02_9BILA|nr:hypothetical protein T10_7295 [Trichinella papuae]